MYPYSEALKLIKTFEGFNEKAFADPSTGGKPYSLGYGTTYYPDGTPVKQGHRCTKEKALEYLLYEVRIIADELEKLNLDLDQSMENALISFVHSVGWKPFLYSNIIDYCENQNYVAVAHEMSKWIFDENHKVIGGLLDRRRKESKLFLEEQYDDVISSEEVLLAAFRNYEASAKQVKAIRELQERIDPYTLSEFANSFHCEQVQITEEELRSIFTAWT
jgi:lysozyme